MFRKDRGMDRPARPKSAQRGNESTPKLDPAKAAGGGAAAGKPSAARRSNSMPEVELPDTTMGRPSWPRPTTGATPNRLSALLGEPVTRPVGPAVEQTVSEPRRETGKRMHIGQDISISGEITTCDVLVIDGHVDATVRDCGRLEIGPAGTLRGDIEVRNAEIGGHFDGELKVVDRLTVRGTGRVAGVVRYGRLEVTVGGQLRGDIAPADPEEVPADVETEAAEAVVAEGPVRPSAASILKPAEAKPAPSKADTQPEPPLAHDGTPDAEENDVAKSPKANAAAPAAKSAAKPAATGPRTIAESLNRNAAE